MMRHRTITWTLALSSGLALALLVACSGGDPEVSSLDETPRPAMTPQTAPGDAGGRAMFEGLSFAVPERWVEEQPSSGMRQAQYAIPRAEGDPADGECALFVFPGTGGSVEANLQRWYGQFTQPDGGSTEEEANVERFEAGGMPVTLVDVSGTYSGGMSGDGPSPDYRMVAGIIETATDPWFLKCTGPEATMAAAAPEMRRLLESAQP
ncbi:MAG: hypothetical protein PVF68_03705 [Acidobacteriota bacterium]|jgi:hypothetical protein